MYVYIMKCANYYKIGHSKNPKNRRSTIQTHNPLSVKICALYKSENAIQIEKDLHNRYSLKRTRGEWFELDETDLIELKVDLGFDFKIKISDINKTDFENTKENHETKKYRLNNLDLDNAISHFENLFNVNISNTTKIKKACLKYDINIVMNCINNLFERDYSGATAYSKLNTFCKYEFEKQNNPVSYLLGIIKSIYRNHYKIDLSIDNLDTLSINLQGIINIDEFLKEINSQKFYLDSQDFWDKIPSRVKTYAI